MKIENLWSADHICIEGIRYHRSVFRDFSRDLPVGTLFRFKSREDGVLVIERADEKDDARAREMLDANRAEVSRLSALVTTLAADKRALEIERDRWMRRFDKLLGVGK